MEKDQPFRIEYSTQAKAFFEKLADDDPETLEEIREGIRKFLEDPFGKAIPVRIELTPEEQEKFDFLKGRKVKGVAWIVEKDKEVEQSSDRIRVLAEIVEFSFGHGNILELFDPLYKAVTPSLNPDDVKKMICGSQLTSYEIDETEYLKLGFRKKDLDFEMSAPAWILQVRE